MVGKSDVRSKFISDTTALDADGISSAASVSGAGNLTIGGALADGGSVTLSSGRIVTILSAGDDSGITFTVTGTDVNGDAQTEVITGADTGTATGSSYFKTVTQIAASGAAAGNVSAGINNSAADVIFAGRNRLKGAYIVNDAAAGTVEFNDGSPTGTNLMKVGTVASATVTRDITVPDEGVLFPNGAYAKFEVGKMESLTSFIA